mmetsp:Transcript_20557/g.52705  ORF Transcript_20557/g.52705 Transcript_20557/m.52705 type:complete len:141 (+) Transcript_20557:188-610(+)|eukprot:jgi/Tetstr1/424332/TSEL_014898.t1
MRGSGEMGAKALLATVAAAAVVGYLLGRRGQAGVSRKQAWQLVVWKTFHSVKDRDAFLELFAPLAAYVAESEPGTLTYSVSVADNDPTKIMILERYESKLYWEIVHRASQPFLKFKESISGMDFKSGGGQSYIEEHMGKL